MSLVWAGNKWTANKNKMYSKQKHKLSNLWLFVRAFVSHFLADKLVTKCDILKSFVSVGKMDSFGHLPIKQIGNKYWKPTEFVKVTNGEQIICTFCRPNVMFAYPLLDHTKDRQTFHFFRICYGLQIHYKRGICLTVVVLFVDLTKMLKSKGSHLVIYQ